MMNLSKSMQKLLTSLPVNLRLNTVITTDRSYGESSLNLIRENHPTTNSSGRRIADADACAVRPLDIRG